MFESRAGVDPLQRIQSHQLPEQVEKIVPGGGEDVPQGSAGVGLELDVVRETGEAGPGVLCRGPEGEEDLAELVQVRLPGQEGNPARKCLLVTTKRRELVYLRSNSARIQPTAQMSTPTP